MLNSNNPLTISSDSHRIEKPGKRKIALLPYDETGLRTTKTTSWAAVTKAVEDRIPDHLPAPEWANDVDSINKECERKGIPYLLGRRLPMNVSSNYNEVRW